MGCDPRSADDAGWRWHRAHAAQTAGWSPTPPMIAVLDTHIVLWWFDRSRRLTRDQKRMLARNDVDHPLGVADISLWEIAALVEIGRVRLALPVDGGLRRAPAAPRGEAQPVTPAIASEVIALGSTRDWDPADRII